MKNKITYFGKVVHSFNFINNIETNYDAHVCTHKTENNVGEKATDDII